MTGVKSKSSCGSAKVKSLKSVSDGDGLVNRY